MSILFARGQELESIQRLSLRRCFRHFLVVRDLSPRSKGSSETLFCVYTYTYTTVCVLQISVNVRDCDLRLVTNSRFRKSFFSCCRRTWTESSPAGVMSPSPSPPSPPSSENNTLLPSHRKLHSCMAFLLVFCFLFSVRFPIQTKSDLKFQSACPADISDPPGNKNIPGGIGKPRFSE